MQRRLEPGNKYDMHQGVDAAEQNPDLSWLLDRRLLVLIGKGGVGKTALSTALGLAARAAGKRVLLAEVRAPRRIPPLVDRTPVSDGPLELKEGLSWINLTAEAALETYAMRLLKLRAVYRAVFEQQAVRRFLRAVPGLSDILILGHLRHLLDEGRADLIVLDAPSTGPGALMLEAPQAVIETAPPGPLRDGASWIREVLVDPRATAVNLVVLTEELPVSEAIDLYHRLRDRIGVPLGALFVNRVLPDPFPPGSEEVIETLWGHELGRGVLHASRTYRARLGQQQAYLDRLRAGIALPTALLPEMCDEPFGPRPVAELGETFGRLLEVRR